MEVVMQAHLPEERRILYSQVEVQLKGLWDRRIIKRQGIDKWEIALAGTSQAPSRGPQKGWKPYRLGTHWGEDKPDFTSWFRTRIAIPKDFQKPGAFIELGLSPAREALVYLNGTPWQGLSENHTSVPLKNCGHLEKPLNILIEAYTEFPREPQPQYHGKFSIAEIRCVDQVLHDFCFDIQAGLETAKVLDPNSRQYQTLLDLLLEAMKIIHPLPDDPDQLRRSVARAMAGYRKGLESLPSEPGLGKLTLTGHSHIDTAWLWDLVETQRKCGRTFSTVLSLMEFYPEYRFSQSQPQLYQYTKQHYPEIYAKIKQRVREGRWDPAGAPWVEMDSNISGGEALVRQMLYGNLFYEQEFGRRSNVCWLPDAFGYNWNLPQILKKSGIDLFVTTKISWSEITQFPYSIFNWEGADGSRIIGLMPPLNYNGSMLPRDLRDHWDRIRQKNLLDDLVYSFGYGDGGGGPTIEMLEIGKRMSNMTGIPRCEFGTVSEYADRLLSSVDRSRLPVWNGELYLELHRGCQTSQARTKWNNRKSEVLLRDMEIFCSLAFIHGKKYPNERIVPLWHTVLTNQFHDILPGSSVQEVYTEADENYLKVKREAESLLLDAGQAWIGKIDTRGPGDPLVLANTLGWERNDSVSIPLKGSAQDFHFEDQNGCVIDHQVVGEGKGKSVLLSGAGIPSMGYKTLWKIKGKKAGSDSPAIKVSKNGLENRFFRLTLDSKGQIRSLLDKRSSREVFAAGQPGNQLVCFHDEPHCWDAWDIDFNFNENSWVWDQLESLEVVEQGPLRAMIRLARKTELSRLTQKIIIYRDAPRIDFETEVDWQENLVLLKAVFPVQIRSPHATFEIQFGAIERATHRNTPYDRARFEVPHLRWADLSEGNYGVALANDSKYGIDVENNVMRLSLLRAPTSPDKTADKGPHKFTYSLLPHPGDWRSAEVVRHALELNTPLRGLEAVSSAGRLPSHHSWIHADRSNVILESLKKAEKGNDLILRLYESQGSRGPVKIAFGFPVLEVSECNLMEEAGQPLKVAKNAVRLDMGPFEIKTLKIRNGKS